MLHQGQEPTITEEIVKELARKYKSSINESVHEVTFMDGQFFIDCIEGPDASDEKHTIHPIYLRKAIEEGQLIKI